MLRKEQNDLLTQTGPQTPMGAMFRSYWIPALLAEELPENDCAPVRVQLLSERLLAFRDSHGRYGLIEEFCAHRGVSLWFGRNEESGIRCPYHGLEYDATGRCVRMPGQQHVPDGTRIRSYRVIERDAMIWIWPGDQTLADPGTVPVHPHHADPAWQWTNRRLVLTP